MYIIIREDLTGDDRRLEVSKSDLILSLKATAQSLFPSTSSRLLCLYCHNVELIDTKFLGDYNFISFEEIITVIVPSSQPFSDVDYKMALKKLKEKGEFKFKDKKEFFDPMKVDGSGTGGNGGHGTGGDENDWDKSWTKGEEYMNYYPVINEGEKNLNMMNEQRIQKRSNKNFSVFESIGANANFNGAKGTGGLGGYEFIFEASQGRTFESEYVCKVMGYTFKLLHKIEGKWSGICQNFTASSPQGIQNSCSSKLGFDPKQKCWIEQQNFTSQSGLTSSRLFKYMPVSDSTCQVFILNASSNSQNNQNFSSSFQNIKIWLREVCTERENTLLITALHSDSKEVLFSETIVLAGNGNLRTRTITSFGGFGGFGSGFGPEIDTKVILCSEKKVLDEETGQLQPIYS